MIEKIKKNVTFLLVLLYAISIDAQESSVKAFFTTSEMPDLTHMPFCPPKEGSAAFAYDVACYHWGKEQRKDSLRAAIAVRDAVYGIETICHEFSIPFGLQLSKENTPEIYKLLEEALATCDNICIEPKIYWNRTRPFVYFNEPTLTPQDEQFLRTNGSFPSGHTILGYSAALLLTEINPERADTLMSRGMMYGESRIIVGAHWFSDVVAGRMAASIAYAKLHTSQRFLKQMKKCRKEFLKKRTRHQHK